MGGPRGLPSPDRVPTGVFGRLRARSRLCFRLCGVGLASSAGFLALFLLLPLSRLDRRRWLTLRRFVYRNWGRAVVSALQIRITTAGPPPAQPFLLVTNHISYVDIPVLASVCPARFVAKSEVSGWPIIGLLCRMVDTIFVDRRARRDVVRVKDLIAGALADGDGVILFPEGTSTPGRAVDRFRPALLAHVAEAARPVHAAALSYRTAAGAAPAELAVAWWGDMTLLPHLLQLLQLERIEATLVFACETVTSRDRKQLADELHRAVARHFAPSGTGEPEPDRAPQTVTRQP